MTVTLLFFGQTSELTGCRHCEMDLPESSTATEALKTIQEQFPKLAGLKLLFSINQEYSKGTETIKAGDELAVFTAVSGG